MIKCKWREEGKEEYNRKGPRCIRESKRGIKIFLILKHLRNISKNLTNVSFRLRDFSAHGLNMCSNILAIDKILGITETQCVREDWHSSTGEEIVKCSDGLEEGSICNIKKCAADKISVPATCMCFERGSGVTKCRWNRPEFQM